MPPMKLTPTAAMRARDVSRPRAEHLAEAEAAEAAGDELRKPAAAETPSGLRPSGDGRRPARHRRSWAGGGRDEARRRTEPN
ncbi:MAG: hypothetical protein ABSB59_37120 [Streptosporangiaceae bacterium]